MIFFFLNLFIILTFTVFALLYLFGALLPLSTLCWVGCLFPTLPIQSYWVQRNLDLTHQGVKCEDFHMYFLFRISMS